MIISRRGFLKGFAGGIAAAAVPKLVMPSAQASLGATLLDMNGDADGHTHVFTFDYDTDSTRRSVFSNEPPGWTGMWDQVCDNLFHLDPERQIITYVGTTGFALQNLYSSCKEQFKESSALIQYPFPLVMITPEYGELQNGWNVNPSSWDWMRLGCCASEDGTVKMMACVGLSGDDKTPPMYLQSAELGAVEKVNPWNHTVRLTEDIEFLRWKIIDYDLIYSEFTSTGCGFPEGRDFFHSQHGSIRFPFHSVADLNYSP